MWSAPPIGFEPTISCVTGRRALRCSTRAYFLKYPEQESNLQTLGDQPAVGARTKSLCRLAYLGILLEVVLEGLEPPIRSL